MCPAEEMASERNSQDAGEETLGPQPDPKVQSSVVDRQREKGFVQSGVFCVLTTWLSKEVFGGGERAGVTSRGGTHTAQQPPGHGHMFRLRGNVFNSFPLRV